MARRLPVYLLLDCSGSMSGEPIQCVRERVDMLCNSLLSNPMAMDTVHLSVITFASRVQEAAPLTNLFAFSEKMPEISANGTTAMGAALNLLVDCVERDVQRKKARRNAAITARLSSSLLTAIRRTPKSCRKPFGA